jgi:hypothetical protein
LPTVAGGAIIAVVFGCVGIEVAHEHEQRDAARRADIAMQARADEVRTSAVDSVHRQVQMPATFVTAISYQGGSCSPDLGCWDDPSEAPRAAASKLVAALHVGGITVEQASCESDAVSCRILGTIGAAHISYQIARAAVQPGETVTGSQIAGFAGQ